MEEWIAENDGGETLSNMNFLIHVYRDVDERLFASQRERNMLNTLMQEFFEENELLDSWNEFIAKKDEEAKNNAIQEQQTEEVSVQEEAESSEEVSEAHEEEAE